MFEQLSLFEIGQPKPANIRDVKCKYEKPLRRYFCEDHWWAEGCKGCPNYRYAPLVEMIELDDSVEYIDYLSFKSWLYYYYPQFVGMEKQTDRWEYQEKGQNVSVYIGNYYEERKQFISVSYDAKESGCSYPCDTFAEVKEHLDVFMKKMKGGEEKCKEQ